MTDIEIRIQALEEGHKFNVSQDAIQKREEEFLVTLREIKESMLKEKEESGGNAAAGGSSGGGSSAEMATLQEENDRLHAKMIKQEYRITHLVANMEKLLEQRKNK